MGYGIKRVMTVSSIVVNSQWKIQSSYDHYGSPESYGLTSDISIL